MNLAFAAAVPEVVPRFASGAIATKPITDAVFDCAKASADGYSLVRNDVGVIDAGVVVLCHKPF